MQDKASDRNHVDVSNQDCRVKQYLLPMSREFQIEDEIALLGMFDSNPVRVQVLECSILLKHPAFIGNIARRNAWHDLRGVKGEEFTKFGKIACPTDQVVGISVGDGTADRRIIPVVSLSHSLKPIRLCNTVRVNETDDLALRCLDANVSGCV